MADHDDLEDLALRLEDSGGIPVLRRIPVVDRYADDDFPSKRLGLIIDVKTTASIPRATRSSSLPSCPSTSGPRASSTASATAMPGSKIPESLPKEISRLARHPR